uniref:Uncharacterized protein n=1 Tax=Anopheles culicifacies TaxID=139723 RepID=A0A182M7L4_9DIPT
MMNDPAALGMIPFDTIGLYEQPKPRFIFKMPRVVPDQKSKFESDDLFKKLSRDSEVRYTGFRDRPIEERRGRFRAGCCEGHTEVSFAATGINLQLVFNPNHGLYHHPHHHHHHHPAHLGLEKECDFDKEHGKSMQFHALTPPYYGFLSIGADCGTIVTTGRRSSSGQPGTGNVQVLDMHLPFFFEGVTAYDSNTMNDSRIGEM